MHAHWLRTTVKTAAATAVAVTTARTERISYRCDIKLNHNSEYFARICISTQKSNKNESKQARYQSDRGRKRKIERSGHLLILVGKSPTLWYLRIFNNIVRVE